MSTPREQYHAMLDELDAESRLHLIDHVPFAKLLEEVDPIAYRCGCSDYQAACDECGREFWAGDPDEPAVCPECAAEKCSECDEPLDDGEGYDGRCGNCADRAEPDNEADEP